MHSLRRSDPYEPSASLPLWTLWAVAPVVVALGIIGGMAAAAYLSPAPPARPSAASQASRAEELDPSGAASTAQPAPNSSARSTPSNVFTPPETEATGRDFLSATDIGASPSPGQTPRAVLNLSDAKAELDQYFAYYTDNGATVARVEYQLMRNTGYSTSLVGMISVNDYEGWAAALRANPGHLKAWLETAATRVRPALEKEHAFLAWAVLAVRKERPAGFTDDEVRLLKDGNYLITRPLASTADPGQSSVALRPATSFAPPAPGAAGPWMTYGPQIRFESTDMYRPLGPDGKQVRN